MRFVYGKNDWKTFERGEENCYLMTNGLGGFSSLSLIASCSRSDHAVFMACTHSPNHRINMIHRLEEVLELDGRRVYLSSQDFQCHEKREQGYLYQSGFVFEDYPKWTYLVEGIEVSRTIVMEQGHNTIGISYSIRNRSEHPLKFNVTPHLQFVPKGKRMSQKQSFQMTDSMITSNGYCMYYRTNGFCREVEPCFCDTLYYADDMCDGKVALGRSMVVHEIIIEAASGTEEILEIVYSTEDVLPAVSEITKALTDYRKELKMQAAFEDEIAGRLAISADQFISDRASTGGKTILAGFPFFEDWGRDTMIALTGCCLSTRQFETAESILRTFMAYCRKGLMPNLFPEGTSEPGYNTVDAALLFVVAVYEYYQRTGNLEFVKEAYPVMKEIVTWYQKGTDFGISMDEDGLIRAGQGYDQVTWMDVRVEDILPTPRHGKPVEINAYWYNALRIMELFTRELNISAEEADKDYGALAELVKESFCEKFWMEERHCLKDVLSGTSADEQIRCNQIWAISLPFSLLPEEREKAVVETVFRKLYTPYGLRTLDPADAQFRPFYGGAQLDRDLAYHQGTVWTFPMGAYYLAYLKVHHYSDEARTYVKEQLTAMEAALREGCIGQLPEIYDGANPVSSKGCFAQAWSVGEILRVYDALRMNGENN
uniref:amylo-alpha-1,6-glucosidase n=1 Tax=Acetatifactor sp. TaxID=1872090 RepID=UPI004056B264